MYSRATIFLAFLIYCGRKLTMHPDDILKYILAIILFAVAIGSMIHAQWNIVGIIVGGVLGYICPKLQGQ